ncbi:deoxyribodipyrimidine photo-lyase, partial [SAR116 cluster bacterium]|nr:deoxyribodipyrimidine photo-lyase [SAR116 cluster bacterium]
MIDEINIVWFKRDLRIKDHTPIYKASKESIPFIPLYVLDQNYWSQDFSSIRHWNFVYDCLEELNIELSNIGQPLIIKKGSATNIFKDIQSNFKINKVYAHEETSNDWVRKKNLSVKNWFEKNQIEFIEYPTNGVVRGLKSRDEWIKIKNQRLVSELTPSPVRLKKIDYYKSDLISRKSIIFEDDLIFNIQKGGRKTGLKILDTFLNLRSKSYLKNISSPKYSSEYCSRISPYLTWGAISSKEVIKKVKHAKDLNTKEDKYWKKNLTSFQSRLSWRCHFIQKLED